MLVKEFDAQLRKGENTGPWTCVVIDDVAELFGTRAREDPQCDQRPPVRRRAYGAGRWHQQAACQAKLRKAIGKEAGDTVDVRIDELIGKPPRPVDSPSAAAGARPQSGTVVETYFGRNSRRLVVPAGRCYGRGYVSVHC